MESQKPQKYRLRDSERLYNRKGEAYVRKKTFLSDQWKYSRI